MTDDRPHAPHGDDDDCVPECHTDRGAHVCHYVQPDGGVGRNVRCHLDGYHGGRCAICEHTAQHCGHQPFRATIALCTELDCRPHRPLEINPCLIQQHGDRDHLHRCALECAHDQPHRCRECGLDYETPREAYLRRTDPMYVTRRVETTPQLITVIGGGSRYPGTETAREELYIRIDPTVDGLMVHDRLRQFVRDLDWELRTKRVTGTSDATATVATDDDDRRPM